MIELAPHALPERSPLQREPEQPPCDSSAEALVLQGIFAVPERMRHVDLTPHLGCFPEHAAIWRALREVGPDAQDPWQEAFAVLARERTPQEAMALLEVLDWAPQQIVGDSDRGCLIFLLALKSIERCTQARRAIHAKQLEVTRLWRVPNTPYTPDEKLRLCPRETIRVDV